MKRITSKQAGFVASGLMLTLIAGGAGASWLQERTAQPGAQGLTQQRAADVTTSGDPWWNAGRAGGGNDSGTGRSGGFAYGSGDSPATATQTTEPATDTQARGVVLVETVLGYQEAEAAGTGIVLTADGTVLTNNHVVAGATQIKVTVAATGESYTAHVVGTDATKDVAVLQLEGASGLATAAIDDDGGVRAGDPVTAVGNAGGTGSLTAADGAVTALEQSITTQSEQAAQGESLAGLIEVSADVVAGDSGGPLLDADGEVVGIDTAASSGTADVTGYAIPIEDALGVANTILAGTGSSTVVIGYPAFLGVQVSSQYAGIGGAPVAGVIDGTPAAQAGLSAGSLITAVGGTAITSADALTAALAAHQPGDTVALTWTDAVGQQHTANVVLAQGPAA